MNPDAWSTVRVTMPEVAVDEPALSRATQQLDELGALLASRTDVGGVETRDPTCITEGDEFATVERPELIAYTTPNARADVEASARELASMLGLAVVIEVEDHEGDAWRDAWKRHHRALYFRAEGLDLMIRPSWIPRESDDPTRELVLDPGRAFGTGLHESTRLCLQALVELAASGRPAPRRVLDLGCGSGILGLAAMTLWPTTTELCLADSDAEAIATARENLQHNAMPRLATARIEFRRLSLGADPPEPALIPASLVFANIRPQVLIPAGPTLRAAVEPGGLLILSGILDEEADEVLEAYRSLDLQSRPSEGGWCALILGVT